MKQKTNLSNQIDAANPKAMLDMNIQQVMESIEGDIYFDIRFHIYLQSQLCKILLNVEAQKSSDAGSLGYHIENRMEFYLARMLSAQKGTEFIKTDRHFLMEGILIQIRTGGTFEVSKNKLIQMLEELFGKDSSEVKKRKLEDQSFVITQTLERRMQDMCNYSELIEKRGIEQGVEQGKESTIIELIGKGLLTVQQGAEQLQISLGELERIAIVVWLNNWQLVTPPTERIS